MAEKLVEWMAENWDIQWADWLVDWWVKLVVSLVG
jgi:hypothetical protein